MPNKRYATLVDYMERTGTNATRLLKLANVKLRRPISAPLFSMILRGSRRCSLENAWALHQVTGVSMEELTRWPRYEDARNSRSVA